MHCCELMKSVGNNASWSLLFMKVMVWNFVTLILVMLWFGWSWQNGYLQIVYLEFSLQSDWYFTAVYSDIFQGVVQDFSVKLYIGPWYWSILHIAHRNGSSEEQCLGLEWRHEVSPEKYFAVQASTKNWRWKLCADMHMPSGTAPKFRTLSL
jgi:hypothetical protein